MGKRKRICHFCGKEYEYCPRCAEDQFKPVWMFSWCSEPCYEIDRILSAYTTHFKTAEETMEEVKEYLPMAHPAENRPDFQKVMNMLEKELAEKAKIKKKVVSQQHKTIDKK